VPLECRAEDGFIPDPGRAAARMEGVRAIALVTPNNPTGAVYPSEVIARFAELARRHDAWLVLDETYRDFLDPTQSPPHALFDMPDWREHIIHLYSFSKAYCVPGHRVAAIAAGSAFREEVMKAIDTMQICAPGGADRPCLGIGALRDWRAGNRDDGAAAPPPRRAASPAGGRPWGIFPICACPRGCAEPGHGRRAGVARGLLGCRTVLRAGSGAPSAPRLRQCGGGGDRRGAVATVMALDAGGAGPCRPVPDIRRTTPRRRGACRWPCPPSPPHRHRRHGSPIHAEAAKAARRKSGEQGKPEVCARV